MLLQVIRMNLLRSLRAFYVAHSIDL